jgi:hypothetical protein
MQWEKAKAAAPGVDARALDPVVALGGVDDPHPAAPAPTRTVARTRLVIDCAVVRMTTLPRLVIEQGSSRPSPVTGR